MAFYWYIAYISLTNMQKNLFLQKSNVLATYFNTLINVPMKHIQLYAMMGRDHFEDTGINLGIILKRILKRRV